MIICPFNDLVRYAPIIPGLEEAMDVIKNRKEWTPGTIPLSGGNRILVQDVTSGTPDGRLCEAHRKFLDIQYIVDGEETVGWAPLEALTLEGEFSEEKDIGFYAGKVDFFRISAGNCYVAFPEDAHMPGLHLDKERTYRKMVLKLHI